MNEEEREFKELNARMDLNAILNNIALTWHALIGSHGEIETTDPHISLYAGPIYANLSHVDFTGDKLLISKKPKHNNDTHQTIISKFVIDGHASFSISKIKNASSDRCEYNPETNKILLKGNVTITADKHTHTGDQLFYDVRTGQGTLIDKKGKEIQIDIGKAIKPSFEMQRVAKLIIRFLNLRDEGRIGNKNKPVEDDLTDFFSKFLKPADPKVFMENPEMMGRRRFLKRGAGYTVAAGFMAIGAGGIYGALEEDKNKNKRKMPDGYWEGLKQEAQDFVYAGKCALPGTGLVFAGGAACIILDSKEWESRKKKIESLCQVLMPHIAEIEAELGIHTPPPPAPKERLK